MKPVLAGIAVVVIGCGGGDNAGEPIGGTIAFGLMGETIRPTAGAAVQFESTLPTEMNIFIATSTVRCGFDGTEDPPDYVLQTTVDNTGPATWQTPVSIYHIAEAGEAFTSSATGTVVIDSIGAERITGSITYSDPAFTPPVTATGTFDIIRCF